MRAFASTTRSKNESAEHNFARSRGADGPEHQIFSAFASSLPIQRKASCACGGGCPACQGKSSDLNVSQPNDPAEIEADQIADKVMRMPVGEVGRHDNGGGTKPPTQIAGSKPTTSAGNPLNAIHRKCDACEDDDEVPETVQRKESSASAAPEPPPDGTPSSIKNVINSGGRSLDDQTRSFFEARFETDLSHVRVHTDSTAGQSARSIDAKAYTLGSNIVFGSGEYQPGTESGKHLLAHELAHAVQHNSDGGVHRQAVIHRKGADTDGKACESITEHAFFGTINDSKPLEPHFLSRKYHALMETEPGSGRQTRRPLGNDLVTGTEVEIRLIDSSGTKGAFLGVCDSIPGLLPTKQILYVPAQYVTPKQQAPAAAASSQPQSSSLAPGTVHSSHGVRDPRVDNLFAVIESLPFALTDQGAAQELEYAAPGLEIGDPNNYQPLMTMLDSHFGMDEGAVILTAWELLQINGVSNSPANEATSGEDFSEGQSIPGPADDIVTAVSDTPPASMTGTELETEINDLRFMLDLPALDPANPTWEELWNIEAEHEATHPRHYELQVEYFNRREMSDEVRETLDKVAAQQRDKGLSITDAISIGLTLQNPATAPMAVFEAGSAVLGKPVEDFAMGFLPGLLAGGVIEMPRDAFQKFSAETREHPIKFNAGLMLGMPWGAILGLRDMLVGLFELGKLAVEFSPLGVAWASAKDAYRITFDAEAFDAEKKAEVAQRQAIAEAVVEMITSLMRDPAFMISHGRELGEIAGRAAGRWFNEDFMKRTTFDKGFTIGEVEGRIVFEIAALFLGPEEWFARGAIAVGEFARLSGPLRRAIIAAIEKIPALKILMEAKNAAKTERLVAKTGDAAADAAKLGDEAGDIGRTGRLVDNAGNAIGKLSDEAAEIARTLDPEDLADVGPVNNDSIRFFKEHPEKLRAWAEFPEAAQALKFCESPCWPEGLDATDIKRLDEFVRKAKSQGLKFSRKKLNDALESPDVNVDDLITDLERKVADPMVDAAEREMQLGQGDEADRLTPEDFGHENEIPTIPKVNLAEDHHIATKYREANVALFKRAGLSIDDDLNLVKDFQDHGQLRGWYDWRNRNYRFEMKGHHPEYNAWVTKTLRTAIPKGIPPDVAMGRIQAVTQKLETIIRDFPEVLSHGPGILPETLRVVTY